jgi:AcrR family transcriptional regulator
MAQRRLARRRAPTQARSEATVQAILLATDQLLAARGLDDLTTHDIAERAGVSVGTLYQYFPSKEAVVGEMIHRQMVDFYERLHSQSTAMADAPIGEVVALVCQSVIDTLLERPSLATLMAHDRARIAGAEIVRARKELAVSMVSAVLASRAEAANVGDVELASWVFVELLQNGVRAAFHEREQQTRDGRLTRELTRITCGYLGVPLPTRWPVPRAVTDPRAGSKKR